MNAAHYNKKEHFNFIPVLLFALVVVATVVAYHRVLFNFFAGDDYCHLAWLAAAAKDPRLLMENFTGPWLGGMVTHFYRPVISIVMLADYSCWKDNATGYHMTNLAGLLLASLFLFFVFDSIAKLAVSGADTRAGLWAVASAGLFALYPLHPEAVSWIIGRVDVISTLFYASALCFYIWWRTSKKTIFFVAALTAAVLGLLSKEMVVTLPAVMFAFELLFGGAADSMAGEHLSDFQLKIGQVLTLYAVGAKLWQAFKNTAPFWVLLACYAIIRRLALGTFTGGYDVSWSFVSGPQLILQTWVHSLHVLLVPINHDFMGARDWHTRTWELFIIVSAVSVLAATCTNAGTRRLFMFLLLWFVVALVPLYNIFSIGNELQGGRFGYLPSAPLSGLLLLGYFFTNAGTIGSTLLRLCVPCFLLLSANILYVNNEAWHSNGVQLSAIEQALSKALNGLPSDSQVLLLNLPDTIHGAYACHNATDGILFRIGAKVDPYHCLAVSRFQSSFPCGFLKDSISANANKIRFLWWDPMQLNFVAINPVAATQLSPTNASLQLSSTDLRRPNADLQQAKELLTPVPAPGVSYKRLADGSLYVVSTIQGIRPRIDITSLTGRSCWNVDFISMKIIVPQNGSTGGPCGCDLIYANASNPKLGDLHYREHANLAAHPGTQSLVFGLRGDEAWTFGGKISGCAVLLPDQCRLILKDIRIALPYNVIPRLNFANGDYFHSKGYVGLDSEHTKQLLQYDASGIANAKKVVVELSRPNVFFEYANAADIGNTTGRTFTLPGLKGSFCLDRRQFPAPGYYGLRLRAEDKNGQNVGLASDHIIIQVRH